jgi:hypothetical protein
MLVVVRNPLLRIAIPLILFGIIYFTVIKPNNDTANRALSQGTQQVSQAEQQLNNSVQKANRTSAGSVPAKVQKLTACIASAGTDVSKITLCKTQYAATP